MFLSDMRSGTQFTCIGFDEDYIRILAIRSGLATATDVTCVRNIRRGPVVVRAADQEIAVGRNIAARIEVSPSTREGESDGLL